MKELLQRLQSRRGIERFSIYEETDGVLRVDVWMDGNSYIDKAVSGVRRELDTAAREKNCRVKITIAAILERFEVGRENGPTISTHHQSIEKAD
ncbi:hypothetical protein [Terrihabitans rhizophilus]|uniref:Uncharacterized protein n=1 Tax=Terrihabitans rhizophilus TaxID=3092662 RepID=A0ABU4RPN8_9HYPH|nr:hypothetical protein [Terrihabitans sp. PJ23]MDX6806143.1 hypothetical protein [Terrihabitans sp. PJ23]